MKLIIALTIAAIAIFLLVSIKPEESFIETHNHEAADIEDDLPFLNGER